jgi:hypothetical protein
MHRVVGTFIAYAKLGNRAYLQWLADDDLQEAGQRASELTPILIAQTARKPGCAGAGVLAATDCRGSAECKARTSAA